MGDINSSHCYDLCDIPFACCDGAGGVSILNITSINGVPPGSGGDGPTPAAPPNTSVQWNNNGAFAGSSQFLWDNTAAHLNIAATNFGSPGLYLSEPTNGRTGSLFTDQVGYQLVAGPNTSLYLYAPNGIEAITNQQFTFSSDSASGYAYAFGTGASEFGMIIMPNNAVGINLTQPPGYMFEVAGDINIVDPGNVNGYTYRINGIPLDFSGGQPAPPDRAVQFNNGGAFGGTFNLVYSTTGNLGIGTSNPEVSVHANGGILSMGYPTTWPDSGPGIMMFVDPSSNGANGSAIYSYNFGPNTALDLNIYAHNLVGNVTTSSFSGRMGIGKAPGASFALDVNGNVTASGCYYILNVPWACLDSNGTSIDLQNIAKINGAAPGGGGQNQTPWLSNIDGANFLLSSVGGLGVGPGTTAQSNIPLKVIAAPGGILAWFQNTAATSAAQIALYNDSNGAGTFTVYGSGTGANANCAALNMGANTPGFLIQMNSSEVFRVTNLPNRFVGIKQSNPAYQLDVTGDVNVTGVYRINGVPLSTGQAQTPWISNIDGAGFALGNTGNVAIGAAVTVGNNNPRLSIATAAGGLGPAISINNTGNTTYAMYATSTVATGACTIRLGNDSSNAIVIGMACSSSVNYPPNQAFITPWGSSDLLFMTANGATERMRITQAGNIGIGTSTPSVPLQIYGNVSGEIARFQPTSNASNQRAYFSLYSTNPQYWWEFSLQDSSGGGTANGLAFCERSSAASTPRLYLAQGGNVGIGTANPRSLLEIHQPTSSGYQLILGSDSPSAGWGMALQSTTSAFIIDEVGISSRFAIIPGGNVGIGIVAPAAKLDCSGMIRCTGINPVPTTGAGVEIFWNGSSGQIDAYDRAAGVFHALTIQGRGGPVGIGISVLSASFSCVIDGGTQANCNIGFGATGGCSSIQAINDAQSAYVPLCILSNRLGIMNQAPAHTLDVSGDVNCTGGFFVNGTPHLAEVYDVINAMQAQINDLTLQIRLLGGVV